MSALVFCGEPLEILFHRSLRLPYNGPIIFFNPLIGKELIT
jgi:hypothetical protein